ncbi:hypothetical protein M2372_002012 [Chryseobacterium sp. BIGb0232]|nr:hypothetical protein [Chryseobacterium sp. BIGb0232]ROS17222.1 hypothetical protein EDF65_1585 [Chryseobacterium nakagawai]
MCVFMNLKPHFHKGENGVLTLYIVMLWINIDCFETAVYIDNVFYF